MARWLETPGSVGLAALAVMTALAVTAAVGCEPDEAVEAVRPEVLETGPNQVTIAWESPERSVGRIHLQAEGAEGEPQTAAETPPPSRKHELSVTGLEPGARYQYWFAGSERRFGFQTQPLPTSPFSLLVTWGELSGALEPLVTSESAAFVLALSPSAAQAEPYRQLRAAVPVYGPGGIHSTVLERPRSQRWSLDWGGLRLVLASESAELTELLARPGPHTIGLLVRGEGLEPDTLRSSPLHDGLVAHNEAMPAHQVSFVLAPGRSDTAVEADGVVYLGIPQHGGDQAAGALRIDVGPESTVARFVEQGREVILRRSAMGRRRTCSECRELADRGAYEESVKAYQEFIASHEGHYQIDDAHYAIAEILDERLFRFADALTWYRKLLSGYPDSTLAPLARQRVEFLTAHGDYDFLPLARFERIRKVELARQQQDPAKRAAVLEQVGQIVADYPDSTLAPQMRYWLANQYRASEPDRAVAIYRALLAEHPDYVGADDARIEIGETYYEVRRYGEAIEAFGQALEQVPSRAQAIEAQIHRAERNQRRGRFAWGAWIGLSLILFPAAFRRPKGPRGGGLRRAGLAFALLAALSLVAGWLSHEQFRSPGELAGLALGIAGSAAVGAACAARLSRQLLGIESGEPRRGRLVLAGLASTGFGLMALLSGAYLTIFYLNEHYLTVFGL